ncbi:Transmembrane osmosensor [Saitoella coloradoensis]
MNGYSNGYTSPEARPYSAGQGYPTNPPTTAHGQQLQARHIEWDIGVVISNPFWLITGSVAIIAWLIAFIASIAGDAQSDFPHFAWWVIMYQICVIAAVLCAVITSTIPEYTLALVGLVVTAFSWTCSITNTLIYSDSSAFSAAGAGHLLLSIINLLWILYIGTAPTAFPRSYIDSYSIPHLPSSTNGGGLASTPYPFSSSHATQKSPPTSSASPLPHPHVSAPHESTNQTTTAVEDETLPAPMEYPYRAKAIYSYTANPEDPNELSFAKGEDLEISDISGKWFQARKVGGEVGIVPSNYVTILDR